MSRKLYKIRSIELSKFPPKKKKKKDKKYLHQSLITHTDNQWTSKIDAVHRGHGLRSDWRLEYAYVGAGTLPPAIGPSSSALDGAQNGPICNRHFFVTSGLEEIAISIVPTRYRSWSCTRKKYPSDTKSRYIFDFLNRFDKNLLLKISYKSKNWI